MKIWVPQFDSSLNRIQITIHQYKKHLIFLKQESNPNSAESKPIMGMIALFSKLFKDIMRIYIRMNLIMADAFFLRVQI